MIEQQTISIYVHFPWCVRKCHYCDFNSYALTADKKQTEELYLKKLLIDLEQSINEIYYEYNKTKLISIFFGGGTPSLLSSQSIEQILLVINKKFNLNATEITLEVNPGATEQGLIKEYRMLGINRISIGVQSFQDDKLKILGRIHNFSDLMNTIDKVLSANFDSFNLDLMYGLPKQKLEDVLYDLSTGISLNPNHISWYQLTIEPNTLFYVKRPEIPDDEIIWDFYQQGYKLLKDHKYINYEISAFAKDPYFCQHNLNYWQYGDYLGVGAGAHSKISKKNFNNLEIIRMVRAKTPKKYLALAPKDLILSKKTLSKKEIIFEFMLNNLRLNQGFTKNDFANKTGFNIEYIEPQLQLAIAKGLLKYQNGLVKPTKFGRRFLNDLQELFLLV